MKATKKLLQTSAALAALLSLTANNAKAQSQYFTSAVANGGTYSWDLANWNAANSGANAGPYTFNWTAGQFARFYNGAGDNYTVTVNAAESMAGMFLNAGSGVTLNVNDAGSGTGSLSIVSGTAVTQNGFSWLPQGFLTGGGNLNLNAQITGSGGIEEESGGGNLNLYGNNSYTGGTLFSSSSTFVGYNNANSFGASSSQIGFNGTTFSIMNNTGASGLTIANNVQTIGTTGVNFIGNGSTMSGNWYLGGGSSAINIRNNGVGTTLTLSGVLSATSGSVTYSGANGGTIVLSGQNTYTGNTVIGSSGDTSITVQAGVANAIAGNLVMAGGKFSAGGNNQTMGTLGMTASSTIMFGAPVITTISFTGATATWTAGAILNISDWQGNDVADGGTSSDIFHLSTATTAELADIEVNGNVSTLGEVTLDSSGNLELVVVPEPSTLAIGAIGIGMAAFRIAKRRKA